MRRITRLAALALPTLLLAGCAAGSSGQSAVVAAAPTPAPQALTAYADAALAPALQAYADARGVELTLTGDAASAALLAQRSGTDGDNALDLAGDTLLVAAAQRAGIDGEVRSLPLGRSLYGYWADTAQLTALLGDNAVTALQNADWSEWSDFVETLTAWLADPKETNVTLSGETYTLPAERPDGVTADGVFAAPLDIASGYTAAILAAGEQYTTDALTGPINGVYYAAALETDNRASTDDTALFCRAALTDLLAARGADACQGLSLVPFKCNLEESDLSTEEYNLTGLLNYPVLAGVGTVSINANADEAAQKAAKSAVLWLYSSGEGETALTETLGVVTPWNTASDATTVGAMQVQQVSTGILPGVTFSSTAAAALTANEQALQPGATRTATERRAFTQTVLEILGATDTADVG